MRHTQPALVEPAAHLLGRQRLRDRVARLARRLRARRQPQLPRAVRRGRVDERVARGRPLVRVIASQQRSETYTDGHVFLGAVIGPAQMTRDTAGDAYEQHADAVADRVVRGESAVDLLSGSLGQAQGLLGTLDVQLGQAMVAVAMKVETQRRENDA